MTILCLLVNFYEIFLQVLKELKVVLSILNSSLYIYARAITDQVIPVRAAYQIMWDLRFRGLIWEATYNRIHSGFEGTIF